MKKHLLLIAALAVASSAYAGDIKMYMGEKEINPGTTYFNEISISDEGSYFDVVMNPELSIMANETTYDVQVTAACTSGQQISLCAGGECVKGEKVVKNGITLAANARLKLMFDYMTMVETKEEIPTVTTDITVEELGVASSKKTYTIIMNSTSGVEAVVAEGDVKVSDNAIVYNLEKAGQAAVYSISGAKAIGLDVAGTGSISLQDLPRGVYIYSVAGHSGKVLVK